jgi:hypothetical protein
MLKKINLQCTSCWGGGLLEFDDDGEGGVLEVSNCPFCGAEMETDEEDELDDEEDEF